MKVTVQYNQCLVPYLLYDLLLLAEVSSAGVLAGKGGGGVRVECLSHCSPFSYCPFPVHPCQR